MNAQQKRELELVKLLREMREILRADLVAAGGPQLKLQPELRRRMRLLKRMNKALRGDGES